MAININKALDKAYESKSLKELVDMPLAGFEGVTEETAKGLERLGLPRPFLPAGVQPHERRPRLALARCQRPPPAPLQRERRAVDPALPAVESCGVRADQLEVAHKRTPGLVEPRVHLGLHHREAHRLLDRGVVARDVL
jgi:hypothetical protein